MLTLLSGDLGPLTSELQLAKQSQPHPGTTVLAFMPRLPWPLLLRTQEFSRRVAALVPGPVLKSDSLGGAGVGIGLAKQAGGQHVMHVLNRAIPPPPPPGAVVVVDSPFLKKEKQKQEKSKL